MSDPARPRGETPLRSVFDRLRAKRESALPTRIPRLARDGGAYPLSDGQERLWFIDRMLPGNAAYNIAAAVEMAGPLDLAAFAAALIEIVRRHETLRTSFPAAGGQPVQVISPVAGSPLHLVDLGGLADGRRIADRLGGELAAAPFDLAGGGLLRVGLLRLGPEEHRLVLVLHHIVSDGWSLRILLRETRLLYQAFLERRPSPLPELTVQYVDFVDWQRGWLAGEAAARQLAYWKRELGERPPVLQLPADRLRPAVQSLRGRSLPLVLPPGLSAEIGALTRSAEVTPFITLLAAFQTLLHRLSGQPEILAGFPIANRKRPEIQDLIGFFVNTLALGARFSAGLRFRDLLRSTHEAALGAHANQELPFGRLVKELQPARQTSHSPLVQVVFAYQNLEAASLNLPGLRLTLRDVPRASAMFDLRLDLKEEPLGFAGEIEYSTDLFDAATVSRWAGYLAALLAAAVADPECRVADLPLLSAAESQQLREANDTAVRFAAGGRCLHELIAEQAAGTPDAVAVAAEEGLLSYRELAARSAQLARQLALLGVGPEVRVGICLERSPELMVGLLAVLTAGGAYVPFDPSYPRERLAYMLADSAVPVLLAQPSTLSALPDLEAAGVRVVLLDGAPATCAGPGTVGAPAVHPESLAYVIYTSGSTGRPKGVMNTHAGIVNRLLWMQAQYGLAPGDRVLQKTPVSFDVSVWELFWPLLTGACLVMARPGGHQDGAYLVRTIAEQEITTLHFVPSMLAVFLETPGVERSAGLRRVMASGEALSPALAERYFSRLRAPLHNLYGPTEAAVDVTFSPCDPADRRGLVPIGRPVANTAIHLLDRDLHPVPLGAAGELHIGGVQVARGYLGRPELTAERFVPDPSGDGARLYATGDLARRLPGGEIDYLGRLDHQVKIRGFRIELGEIETVLGHDPEVGEAVVVAEPGRPGESARLVAYVVPVGSGQELARWLTGLRRRLREELPEHMVPAAFVVLGALPLTPSGKVDRRSLPAPERETRDEQALVPPRNPTEEILAAIWTEILGIESCGVEDDFFALGGHSLLANQVVSRIRGLLGIELPLHAFFALPTVAALAERVEAARRSGGTAANTALPPLTAGERIGDEPLSFAQQRLWFLSQLDRESTAYHVAVALRLTGALSPPALAASLAFVVERHETLRTTFALRPDGPVQVVAPPSGWRLPVVDLAGLVEAERQAEMHRLTQAEASRPFDLARGPLLRTLLVRLAEREHVFSLLLHHIVSDGWSMGVLWQETMALYSAAVAGKPPRLPPLPVQYRDFAAWQRRWLTGETLERELGFWRRQLAGAPPLLELPADRARPPVQRFRGRRLPFALPAVQTAGLKRLGQREGATLFMALLAAFDALLHRYSRQNDLVVGFPIAGRRPETEGLIGLFLNTLALRVQVEGGAGWLALLRRVRDVALDAFAHQDLPFEKLVAELGLERNLAHAPLFQTLLVFQNMPAAVADLPGLAVQPLDVGTGTAKFDLVLNVEETSSGLAGWLIYNRDLFDPSTVERMRAHLGELVTSLLAAPERRVDELALLGPAERQQLLTAWNDTAVPGAETPFVTLFTARAARTPDAVALACGDLQISYSELDLRSARLARGLAARTVGPESQVAVLAERGGDLLTAMLALWKLGAAYLPLDPHHPTARLAQTLAQSGSRLVLADEPLCAVAAAVATAERPAATIGDLLEDGRTAGRLPAPPEPAGLAYVLFTSGSTGVPKGAMIEHRGMVNHLAAKIADLGLTASDRVAQTALQTFDISIWQFIAVLVAGGSVDVLPDEVVRDPLSLLSEIERRGLTVFETVPSLLAALLQVEPDRRPDLAALRWAIPTGEALSPELCRQWFAAYPAIPLVNAYGPTECSDDVTHQILRRPPPAGAARTPIGRPVANTRVHVLGPGEEPAPIGVPGELAVAGAQVGRGYWGRPDLTADRFVPDPFSALPGGRLYRTGDLARLRPSGEVAFLGRVDHQVKVRGFRIELGDIEAALAAHPAVREAVVLARADRDEQGGAVDRRLVAYLVTEEESGLSLPELRDWLSRQLPEYMVPSAFVTLAALPLTANGKVDRKALPAPDAGGLAASRERVAPRTDLERHLAGLWAESLGLAASDIGVDDSYFDLGGNSILGAILVNRLQQELGEIVHVVTLFDHPTLEGLARFVAAEYPRAMERLFGQQSRAGGPAAANRVDEGVIAEVDRRVRKLGPIPPEIAALPRNPPAVFVLSPPRSGSTLLRVMLAGHPALFAPPELELLGFDTLAERRATFSGRDAFRLEGLLRAVMEAWSCGPDEAREIVEGWEREGLATREAFRRLQERIGGRMLVDKTPTYTWDAQALRRAEAGFEEPRYIHLVRHPLGMVRSFEEARMDQIFFHGEHRWSRRELAEALWVLAQRSTLELLAEVPAARRHTVVFEELLSDPERVLRGVCGFLGLAWDPTMADPYKPSSVRMTDGLHAESRMLGDVKFQQHGRVEAEVAGRWRRELSEEGLGGPARELAERLGYPMPPAGGWTPIPRVEAEPGTPHVLSFSQERFWFLERLDRNQATSIIPVAVRLVGRLRPDILSAALEEVVRRHASLRTTFAEQRGRPVQIVAPPAPVPLPCVDLAGLPKEAAEAEARLLAARELRRPFDLGKGPLLRVLLLPLPGGRDHALLLAMHHIVSDGWSTGVLMREMGILYQGGRLPELPIQYTDFARWQREELRGERLETEVGYWRERLANLPALDLPVDRQASGDGFRADAVGLTVPPELTAKLVELSREHGATLFMTLLAVLHALLARHTGQDDVAVASPMAGRNRVETEGLIGLFLNTLVLRGDLSGSPTFLEVLERERGAVLGAFGHQDVPFSVLVEALRPERRLGSNPFAEVLFSLQNQPIPTLRLPELALERLGMEGSGEENEVRTAFSLAVLLGEAGGELTGGLGFNTALIGRATAERWRDNFLALLAAMAERPGQPISEAPLLGVGERRQVVTAAPKRRAAVSESVAQERAELSSRRGQLPAAKRDLLEKWLRGRLKGAAVAARPAATAAPKILVPLQAGHASRTPFFCVHAVGGSVFSYGELARALGPEHPFYGVQSPGLDGGPPLDEVPAMAAAYVDEVESAAPDGPVLLGGWSFGGVVAFEMARQLRARGRTVPLVALLDSYAPTGANLLAGRSDAELLRPLLRDQARLQGRDAEWLDEMPVAGEETVIRMLERARAAGVLRADVRRDNVERLLGVYKANLRALSAYRPQPYGGRIVLFRSESSTARSAGWEGLSSEPIATEPVGGDHYSMLAPPHVAGLAQKLSAALERPTAGLLHQGFEARADLAPLATAVVAGNTRLSYAGLEARANRLARYLRSLGVGPEVRVGLCLERSEQLLVGILGVLKAGGAYVPLDPTYPAERLAFLLKDSRAPVVLTRTSLLPVLPEHEARLVLVDRQAGEIAACSPDRPEPSALQPSTLPQNLAYFIYTSGSTGRAKGVAITHHSAGELVRWASRVYPREDLAGVLFATSICFDLSIFEMFVPLTLGGAVIVAGNALELPDLPAAGEVTLVNTVPSAMTELVRQGAVPPSVRVVNLAGEALPGALVEAIYGTTSARRVYNLYGPSEDTTYSTWALIPEDASIEPPIGRPVDGTRAWLLDEQGRPVPAGEVGEIFLGGEGLARGYFDRPDLTADRFVPDPFSGVPGARLYRTGDLARELPGGDLHYLGRLDHQVKIRGFRIELGEIEAGLLRHPTVREAVVGARGNVADRHLVAWFAAGPPAPSARELREHLQKILPGFMVPSAFIRVDELPRTPNGKVDRKSLPEPGAVDDGSSVASRNEVEEGICRIWGDVLGLEHVGVHDSFFEVGGHSLLGGRVLARVRDLFGVDLPLSVLMAGSTVAALAQSVESARRSSPLSGARPVPVPRNGLLPLSPSQRGLWFLDRMAPGLAVYNIATGAVLSGPLDRAALAAALGAVVRRHEPLRTRFPEVGAGPWQEILPPASFVLPIIDLSALPREAREAELEGRGLEQARGAFDLARELLLRACLVCLAPREHVLLVTVHHIVFDGWSEGVFWSDLSAFYVGGGSAPLPELHVQHADHIVWQLGRFEERGAAQVAWWRHRLDGVAQLELPTDRPRPAARTWRGDVRTWSLPSPLASVLRAFARQQGATPFTALLAGFSALLSRYSHQDRFAVGAPVAGRTLSEQEGLIGLYANVLALHADLSGRPSFLDLVERTRETLLSAMDHQELPFDRLVQELNPDRDLSRNPIFPVLFQVVDRARPLPALPGIAASPAGFHNGAAKLDLEVEVEDRGGDSPMTGRCDFDVDLFDALTVERLLRHFNELLAAALAEPERPLDELSFLSEAESRQLLEWSGAGLDPVPWRPVHHLFEERARRAPGALAVSWGGERAGSLTYGELDRRAGALARRLRALGVGPEVRVGVCLERSPDLVVSVLAVLKTGGAYVAFDPDHPAERLAFQLEDSRVPVVLARRGTVDGLVPGVLIVAPDEEPAESGEAGLEWPEPLPGHLAYVIYTSGSTGRPKGVELTHASLLNLVAWHVRAFGLTPEDRSTLVAGVGFDASVWEVWPALAAGASLHVVPEEARSSPESVRDWLAEQEATVTFLATPLAEAALELEWPPDAALRVLLTGGDRLHQPPPPGLPFVLVNNYGPTEGTVVSTSGAVPPAERHDRALSIGRPIDRARVFVVDRRLHPVPAGVAGELVVGGAGLARGYLGRPDLTADRFVPDALSGQAGERLYRTGDLVRFTPAGDLEFLGRTDHQVKVRVYRIELGEVETALARHPGVREAVVLAREDVPGDKRLVAYVVAKERSPISDLQSHLRRSLPGYMIPAAFVELAALPVTPNGKLDRKALPAPRYEGPAGGGVAPRTPVEERLAAFWRDVLKVEEVSVHDNFFERGGHSLLAMQLVARLRQSFGVEVALRSLFQRPTLAELAAEVEEILAHASAKAASPIRRIPRDGELPLSYSQLRQWFLVQLEPGTSEYNLALALRLRGELDRGALQSALDEIVRRHEALRTVFAVAGGRPVPVIREPEAVRVREIDLSGDAGAREAAVREQVQSESKHVFDLTLGPLFRLALAHLGPGEHYLLLTLHHIVFDGWSYGVFIRELTELYRAFAEGRPSPLPELEVQYVDYAAWQRGWIEGPEAAPLLDYWRDQLAGSEQVLELPLDRPRPVLQTFAGAYEHFSLPPEAAAAIRALGLGERATLFMTLLAAFGALLHRYTGQDDINVGTYVANRRWEQIEKLLGFFVNTLVLRTDLSGGPSFRELLTRVRHTTLGAYDHQDLPVEKLLDELGTERDLSRGPLFQVLFGLANFSTPTVRLPGLEVAPIGLHESGRANMDLVLWMWEEEGAIGGWLQYNTALFEPDTARRMVRHFKALLAGAAEDPRRPLADLPLLPADELEQILVEWNRPGEREPEPDALVHERFERWAEVRPDAVALETADRREILTYAELNRRGNHLAHRLRRLGVGTDSIVGIWAERSVELVVGVLGALKAGGAYMPLDPALPADRLAAILRGSGISVLLARNGRPAGLPPFEGEVVALRESIPSSKPSSPEDNRNPAPWAVPESLVYVLSTSGSTGVPKGVLIPHSALASFAETTRRLYGVGPEDRVLQFSSLVFDVSIEEIFTSWAAGATLVLRDEEMISSPARFLRACGELDVQMVDLPTAYWHELGVELAKGEVPLPSCVRSVIFAGERALLERLAGWQEAMRRGVRLFNSYGPSETTPANSVFDPAEPAVGMSTNGLPIGKPMRGARLYVVDPDLRPVPVGVAGEQLIAGAGLGRGYAGRPNLTAESFVPNPFSSIPGERVYRTGDRVRWLRDGNLEFLGRADDQVKIRGFRVEPGEIAAVICRHPGVREAVVVPRNGGPVGLRLVAYAACGADTAVDPNPTIAELRELVKSVLPAYMVPADFVLLTALPLTATGKLDRRALPEPASGGDHEGYAPPETATEELLAEIWAELLGRGRVGIFDNFFDLGGHSLLVPQVFARIEESFQLKLPLRALFEAPTVAQLANLIEQELLAQIEELSDEEAENLVLSE